MTAANARGYVRQYNDETVLVVAHLSRFSEVAELDLSAFAGFVSEELFGQTFFPKTKTTPATFTLGPSGFCRLCLTSEDSKF